jgi:hypothetical protein
MMYYITDDKWQKISVSITQLLDLMKNDGQASAKLCTSVLGRVTAIRRSHGLITAVMSRSLQHQPGHHTLLHGWAGDISLSAATLAELTFLRDNLPYFHWRPIPTMAAVTHVYALEDVLHQISKVAATSAPMADLYVSDASDEFSYVCTDCTFTYAQDFPFISEQQLSSSTHRELLAVLRALRDDGQRLLSVETRTVYWQTDSQCCVRLLTVGSRVPSLQNLAREVKILETALRITMQPVWTPHLHPRIRLADLGSKLHRSTDEWSVHCYDLARVFVTLRFFQTLMFSPLPAMLFAADSFRSFRNPDPVV